MSMKILCYFHPCYFQVRNSWFLCNRLDEPLKASRHPTVSRSFSRCTCPDARSSYSEFYTDLDFRRHYLGRLCQTSGRCGNMSEHYPVFQNILSLLYGCGKEWQRWASGRLVKLSGCGPVLGRIEAILERRSQKSVRMQLSDRLDATCQSPNLIKIRFSVSL
jgi:hypothetical protein